MTSLADLTDELAEYKAARHAILVGGQELRTGMTADNTIRRADLSVLTEEIRRLEMRIAILKRGRLTHSTAVFEGRR